MYCNAGWTLSTGDVNQDNHDDLLIGSPYASTCGDQCGFVSVLVSFKKCYKKYFFLCEYIFLIIIIYFLYLKHSNTIWM